VPDGAGLEGLESCARLWAIRTSTFQSFPSEKGKSSIHLVLDNHTAAKAVLDQQSADYTETEVARVKLAHRPGELGRAASRLGDAGIKHQLRLLRNRSGDECFDPDRRRRGR
jgi:hypothetical protein